jgi:N-acyl-L-homoserine lactone synthetase
MIDCVTIATSHCFPGNLVAAQHRLRYQEVIAKEDWSNIYVADEMEFDRYDNVATEYFVARNSEGDVLGVCRSYPTTIPYMLADVFPFLSSRDLPSSHKVHEASRLVLDRSLLTKEARRPIVNELIVAYMERGLQRNIDAYVGFMLPRIWASTFLRAGWDVEWLGPETALCDSLRSPCACSLPSQVLGKEVKFPLCSQCEHNRAGLAQPGPGTSDVVRAAWMPVNERMNDKIREATGIQKPVLNYGSESFAPSLVSYSHLRRDNNLAACQ